MGLPVFLWGWKIGNAIADIFTPQLATEEAEKQAIREAEAEKVKQYIPPKAYYSPADGEYQIPLPPSQEGSPPQASPIITDTTIVEEDYVQPDQAGFPPWWQWAGPIPYLYNKLRKKPAIYQPAYTKGLFQYGRLMVDNHSEDPLEMLEWEYMVASADSQVALQKSADGFAWWMAKQGGAPNIGPQIGDFYDQGALLWAVDLRAFNQGLALMYGIQAPADAFANMWIRSRNAIATTTRGVTYSGVIPVAVSATNQRDYYEWQAEVDSAVGGAGLALSLARLMRGDREDEPRIVLENSSALATAVLLGKGSYPGYYPRSWCNKSAEEIKAEIAKERELLTNEMAKTSDKNLIKSYESRLKEINEEEAEINSGLIQLNQINNIPEHIQAFSNCLAEIMGAYPFKILLEKGSFLRKKLIPLNLATMEDAEDVPIKYVIEELPDETISVPNVAEALAEVTGMLLNLQGFQDLNFEFVQRMSAELIALRTTTAQTFDRTDAIMDFLGFDLSYVNEKMPISFSPNADKDEILNLLQGSMVKYKKPLFKANKHNSTLQVQLYHLLKGASIIKAVHFRPFDSDGPLASIFNDEDTDFGKYLKKLVKGLNQDSEAKIKMADGTEVAMNFDEFIKFVETGWAQFTIDPDDARKPYGKDYSKRPRISDLSKGDS